MRLKINSNYQNKLPIKEFLQFGFLVLMCFISVYIVPQIINKAFFASLLVYSYFSKKDYFWFALIFVLICTPGSLFFGNTAAETHRLPIYTVVSGISFSIFDIFLLLSLLKAINKTKRNPLLMRKEFTFLGLYYILVLIYSFLFGMSFDNIIRVLRNTIFFTLLISLPRLMYRKEDFYRFSHLVFPFVFLVLIGAFSQLMFGSRLIDSWAGQETNINYALSRGAQELYQRPNLYGVILCFFSLVFGLYYYSRKDYQGNKFYLITIVSTSFLCFIISQTRSWISIAMIILIMSILFVLRIQNKTTFLLVISLTLFLLAYLFLPPLQVAVDNGWKRFSTIKSLASGDITAGGTNIRYSERLPQVMEGFVQSPIIGFGFSDIYLAYADYHVGIATMLLQLGVIGAVIFSIFLYKFSTSISTVNKHCTNKNPYKKSILIFNIIILSILILHITSYLFMGFEFMLPSDYFFICLFFAFADNQIKSALSFK